MSEKYLIALDVGGTKADAVLFKENGKIVKRHVGLGGSPFDFGLEACLERILGTVEQLLDGFSHRIEALYAAIATVEYYYDDFCRAFDERFKSRIKHIRLEGDGVAMISAILGHNDGASLICGTGSALYMRKGEHYEHIGGGGHLIDSCGSGFSIGHYTLQAALRAADGATHKNLICDLIRRDFGGNDPWADQPTVYSKGRAYIASFAKYMFEARNLGDVTARSIFNKCSSDMADFIWAAYEKLGKENVTIILNGGIFRNYPEYAAAVIAAGPKDVHFICSDLPPIYGSAVEAMYDIGQTSLPDTFKSNFMDSYGK